MVDIFPIGAGATRYFGNLDVPDGGYVGNVDGIPIIIFDYTNDALQLRGTNILGAGSITADSLTLTGLADTHIPYSDDGVLTGDASFTINKTTKAVSIGGIGDGGRTNYDLKIGDTSTPDYGMIQFGNAVLGRTSYKAGNIDLDGSILFQNIGGPVTSQVEFCFATSTGASTRFALAKPGIGNASYHSRSMLLAGPAPADTGYVTVGYWQTTNSIFHNLPCDTVGSGADLGVQGSLEAEVDIFCDSFKESTSGAGITFGHNLILNGTETYGIDLSGGTWSSAVMNWDANPEIFAGGSRIIELDVTGGNYFYGSGAGASITSGTNNVGIGPALGSCTTGASNFALGWLAQGSNTFGLRNFALGLQALRFNVGGADNVAIGDQAGKGLSGQSVFRNIFIGGSSGFNAYGDDLIFIGYKSGINQTTNNNLLIIDNQDRGSAAAEITDCLIYGVMSATPASQSLRFNIGTTIWGNATHEDSDGGRLNRFDFKGQQSGGEETTLARIEVGHDGAVDDEKGYWDLFVNAGSDGDSPTKRMRVDSLGNRIVSKTAGVGIKVDLTTPTFPWRDLLGDQFSKNTGPTKPALVTYNGAIKGWQFSDGDEAYLSFHTPHEYVPGSDIHLHIHWSQTSATATGGTIDFKYTAIYAKGHNQASGSTFTSTPITGTFSSIDINDGSSGLSQYQHHLTEVIISGASATAALFDRDDFEPDGVIEMTFEMVANNLTNSVTVLDPFIHFVDIHEQSTGIGTKEKAPDFYA